MRPDCDPSGIESHARPPVVATQPPRRFKTTAAPAIGFETTAAPPTRIETTKTPLNEPDPTVPTSNVHDGAAEENEIDPDNIFLLQRMGLD